MLRAQLSVVMTDIGLSVLGGPGDGLLAPENLDSTLRGLEYLGGWEAAGNAAGVAATPVLTFAKRQMILVMGRVLWTGATVDRIALQVGQTAGSVDQSAQYWSRNIISRGQDSGTLGNSDGGIFQGASEPSASRWALQFTGGLDPGTIKHRAFFVQFSNITGFSKLATWSMTRNTDAAATTGGIMTGEGEYFGSDAALPQVCTLRLLTIAASLSIGPESGFGVFGRDYSA